MMLVFLIWPRAVLPLMKDNHDHSTRQSASCQFSSPSSTANPTNFFDGIEKFKEEQNIRDSTIGDCRRTCRST